MNQKRTGVILSIMLPVLLILLATEAYPQAWKVEWQKILAAAKKEGKVVVAGPPGQSYRDALIQFGKAYPDIQIEYVGLQGRDFAPRIVQEREAGQFLWDVHVGGASSIMSVMLPKGAVDPLQPHLILPEVLDSSKWQGGFKDCWMEKEGKYIFGFVGAVYYSVHVNRDVVPEAEFNKPEDLWDPKWKGKIVWHDPRGAGNGSIQASVIYRSFGEDALKKLLKDQQAVVTADYRQQVEWVARGRYPLAIGVLDSVLTSFQQQGVGKNILPLKHEKLSSIVSAFGNLVAINKPPHPNAAKVFMNWVLSKEGQNAWAKATGENSRRVDVPPGDPEMLPNPKVQYWQGQKEEGQDLKKKVMAIVKEALQ